MKKILILSILFAMVSCSEQPDTNDVYIVNRKLRLRTVVIDSCEYLISSGRESYTGYGYLSHKGNCKYYTERRKRQ